MHFPGTWNLTLILGRGGARREDLMGRGVAGRLVSRQLPAFHFESPAKCEARPASLPLMAVFIFSTVVSFRQQANSMQMLILSLPLSGPQELIEPAGLPPPHGVHCFLHGASPLIAPGFGCVLFCFVCACVNVSG